MVNAVGTALNQKGMVKGKKFFTLTADYAAGHTVALTSSMANDTHIPGLIRGHEGTIVMVSAFATSQEMMEH